MHPLNWLLLHLPCMRFNHLQPSSITKTTELGNGQQKRAKSSIVCCLGPGWCCGLPSDPNPYHIPPEKDLLLVWVIVIQPLEFKPSHGAALLSALFGRFRLTSPWLQGLNIPCSFSAKPLPRWKHITCFGFCAAGAFLGPSVVFFASRGNARGLWPCFIRCFQPGYWG